MYPEKTITSKESHTPMFIVALFTIARTWKQPNCPSGEERIKSWYINHSKILFDPPPREMEIKTKITKWDQKNLKAFAQQRKT